MKNIKTAYMVLAGAAILLSAVSCERSYPDPDPLPTYELESNISIADLKEVYFRGPTEVLSDLVIEGKVVTDDRYGNFYRIMYIQDETGGIEVKVGKSGLYNFYKPGQTVYIKARGLWLGAYGGMISIGMENTDASTTYENTYIDVQYLINQTIFPGERPAYGEPGVEPHIVTSYDQLTPDKLGTLVKLVGVEFNGLDRLPSFQLSSGEYVNIDTVSTWAVPAYPNNPEIAIPATYAQYKFSMDGGDIIVRTSGYARFAGERVENRAPRGTKVDITGIYTIYNGIKQFVLNTTRDVVPHTESPGEQ